LQSSFAVVVFYFAEARYCKGKLLDRLSTIRQWKNQKDLEQFGKNQRLPNRLLGATTRRRWVVCSAEHENTKGLH